MDRRSATTWLLRGVALLIGAPVAYVVAAYIIPPEHRVISVPAGRLQDIPDKGWMPVMAEGLTAAISRDSTGGVRAVDLRCTHAGCLVVWEARENSFLCHCHGGSFDAQGHPSGGPPTRALAELRTTVSDGQVVVTSERITRDQ